MKKITITSIFLLMLSGILFAQSIPADSLYLGQTPPGSTPKIFAPGIISLPNRAEYNISISPSGKEIIFSLGNWPKRWTMLMEYKNNKWNSPDTIAFSKTRSVDEASFSPSGDRIYYYAYNAPNSFGAADLCYSTNNGSIWSEPVNLGKTINTTEDEYHPCVVADGSIYFENTSGTMCYAKFESDTFRTRVSLPTIFNTSAVYGNPYVAPNESYMIISSSRAGGIGKRDLYISYKRENGKWTNPKNLGNKINTTQDEATSDVTPDGKYLLFNREFVDFYWVSTSFIDTLKYTNFKPYLNIAIPDKKDTAERIFTFTLLDSTFIDDDGNNTLTYSATLSNGNPLPTWLTFDANTKTFSSTSTVVGTYNIKVTAKDTANTSTSDIFNLKIAVNPTKINTIEEQNIQIYPNPTKDYVNISFGENSYKKATVELLDINGKTISTNTFFNNAVAKLDLNDNTKGIYILKLNIDEKIVYKKICIE